MSFAGTVGAIRITATQDLVLTDYPTQAEITAATILQTESIFWGMIDAKAEFKLPKVIRTSSGGFNSYGTIEKKRTYEITFEPTTSFPSVLTPIYDINEVEKVFNTGFLYIRPFYDVTGYTKLLVENPVYVADNSAKDRYVPVNVESYEETQSQGNKYIKVVLSNKNNVL